jgi:STE24 endopeptidase
MNEIEIVAIVRHELGHWKKWHHPLLSLINWFKIAFWFAIYSFIVNNEGTLYSFGFTSFSYFPCFIIFLKANTIFSFLYAIIMRAFKRTFEYQADAFAAEDPKLRKPLKHALFKGHLENASNLNPDNVYSFLNFDHPDLAERIAALNRIS